jgi:colanic acid/amylovoran biosynthesis protein
VVALTPAVTPVTQPPSGPPQAHPDDSPMSTDVPAASATHGRRPVRVHILGTVALNGGDAAILAGTCAMIRTVWPDARITASDTHPAAAARYFPSVQFGPFLAAAALGDPALLRGGGRRTRIRRRLGLARARAAATLIGNGHRGQAAAIGRPELVAALESIAAADIVGYTGGTSLTDNYWLGDKILDLDLASRLGRPLVFFQSSAGPFVKPENRAGLGPVFAAADLVLLRDERSLAHVLDVGARPETCLVVADTAFGLAPEHLPPPRPGGGAPRVAISVREWKHFTGLSPEEGMRRYLDALAAATTALVEQRDADVVFVSTCQGRPEYWLDDSRTAEEVVALLPPHVRARCSVNSDAMDPDALVRYLGTFDALLSTRLHGAILGVCAGVPTAAIAYEYKTREVWKQLDLERWVLDIDDLDADALSTLVIRLLDERLDVAGVLAEAVPRLRAEALGVGPMLAALVVGR